MSLSTHIHATPPTPSLSLHPAAPLYSSPAIFSQHAKTVVLTICRDKTHPDIAVPTSLSRNEDSHLTRNTYFFTFHRYHIFIWVHKEVCTPRRQSEVGSVLTFRQGQEVGSRVFFLTDLPPKYGSLHRKVTLSVNSVQHSRLSFGCHVRLNSRSPSPPTPPPAPEHNRSFSPYHSRLSQ